MIHIMHAADARAHTDARAHKLALLVSLITLTVYFASRPRANEIRGCRNVNVEKHSGRSVLRLAGKFVYNVFLSLFLFLLLSRIPFTVYYAKRLLEL